MRHSCSLCAKRCSALLVKLGVVRSQTGVLWLQLLTVLGAAAIIIFAVVIVPKLGSSKGSGFRNVIIVLTANFQVRSHAARRSASRCCRSQMMWNCSTPSRPEHCRLGFV